MRLIESQGSGPGVGAHGPYRLGLVSLVSGAAETLGARVLTANRAPWFQQGQYPQASGRPRQLRHICERIGLHNRNRCSKASTCKICCRIGRSDIS